MSFPASPVESSRIEAARQQLLDQRRIPETGQFIADFETSDHCLVRIKKQFK